MDVQTIEFKYRKQNGTVAETRVIVNGVPKSVLKEISSKLNTPIRHEGVTHFIEIYLGDIKLKFRLVK